MNIRMEAGTRPGSTPDTVLRLTRPALRGIVDDFLIDRLDPAHESFAVTEVRPALSANRLDLAIKLFYLADGLGRCSRFSAELYEAHLRAFSLGSFQEPGNPNKTQLGHFKSGFEEICHSLRADGFDPGKSIVPLASDGTIINGSHRTACAMFLGKPIWALHTGLDPVRYDYTFFRDRGLNDDLLEAAVVKFVESSPDVSVALVWPAAQGLDDEIEAKLGPLVYRKAVTFNPDGAHNLLSQVYSDEPWLGDPSRNYPGIRGKWMRCFPSGRPLRVYVFENPRERSLAETKAAIRELFGIGKHSIHITDTHAEAVDLARLLLNERAVHFLQHASPTRFPATLEAISAFSRYLARHGIPTSSAAIDSGTVLAAYGIRETRDLDFICSLVPPEDPHFANHGADHHGVSVADILQDPRLHFHYRGVKFVSLAQVAAMKRRRKMGSDAEDLRAMLPYLALSRAGGILDHIRCEARFAMARTRRLAIRATAALGIEEQARALYRRAARRRLPPARTRH